MSERTAAHVSEVYNLTSGETYVYTLPPDEALISAYMEATGQVSQITEPDARQKVRALIQEGRQTLGIGDFAVLKAPPRQLLDAANDETFVRNIEERENGLTEAEIWALVHRLSFVLSTFNADAMPETHQLAFRNAQAVLKGLPAADESGNTLTQEDVIAQLTSLNWDGVVPPTLIQATMLVLPDLELPEINHHFSHAPR